MTLIFFFFFQAEDGIRDLVRSRGLGDVYKRQEHFMANSKPLASQRILIMATDGFEQSELEVPLERLQAAGAEVDIASLATGDITGWDGDDWGDDVEVDLKISDVKIADYAALVLPGGQINPDLLRVEEDAVALIRDFARADKPIAAICHAPWLLIEAGLVIHPEDTRPEPYEPFRGPLINPIRDARGRVIPLWGRILRTGEPEYFYSPHTPFFDKGRDLYYISQPLPPVRAPRPVLRRRAAAAAPARPAAHAAPQLGQALPETSLREDHRPPRQPAHRRHPAQAAHPRRPRGARARPDRRA